MVPRYQWTGTSSIDHRHHGLAVPRARNLVGRERVVQGFHVAGAQDDRGGGDILVKVGAALGARYRDDGRSLMQQPGEGNLPGPRVLGGRDVAHDLRGRDVGIVVDALVAGVSAAVIILGVVLGAFDRTGQEAATERRERNETNSEFFEGRDHVVLEIALPQGILAL